MSKVSQQQENININEEADNIHAKKGNTKGFGNKKQSSNSLNSTIMSDHSATSNVMTKNGKKRKIGEISNSADESNSDHQGSDQGELAQSSKKRLKLNNGESMERTS